MNIFILHEGKEKPMEPKNITAQTPPETHFFTFDVQKWPPPALARYSVSEWNDGEEVLLARKEYTLFPGGPAHIEYYTSTLTSDKYLTIVRLAPYRFIFYIKDDASLLEWQRQYEQIPPGFLAVKWLPEPKTIPEMITFPMNIKALRGR